MTNRFNDFPLAGFFQKKEYNRYKTEGQKRKEFVSRRARRVRRERNVAGCRFPANND